MGVEIGRQPNWEENDEYSKRETAVCYVTKKQLEMYLKVQTFTKDNSQLLL